MTLFQLLSVQIVSSRDYHWFKTFRLFLWFFISSVFDSNCCCWLDFYLYSYTHTGSFLSVCPNVAVIAAVCRKINEFVFFFSNTQHNYICLFNLLCMWYKLLLLLMWLFDLFSIAFMRNACVNHFMQHMRKQMNMHKHSQCKPISWFSEFLHLL